MDEDLRSLQSVASTDLLFVYGTLLRGEPNHRLIAHCAYAGPGRVAYGYRLVSLGGFPAMTLGDEGREAGVVGEVYRLDDETWARVDRLEGVPHLYTHEAVRLEDGRAVWSYVMGERAHQYPAIERGDWRAYRQRRMPWEFG